MSSSSSWNCTSRATSSRDRSCSTRPKLAPSRYDGCAPSATPRSAAATAVAFMVGRLPAWKPQATLAEVTTSSSAASAGSAPASGVSEAAQRGVPRRASPRSQLRSIRRTPPSCPSGRLRLKRSAPRSTPQGARVIMEVMIVIRCGTAPVPTVLGEHPRIEVSAVPGKDEINRSLTEVGTHRRLLVCVTDAALAAVLTHLMRSENLDVEIAYIAEDDTPATRTYGLPTGSAAAKLGVRGEAREMPLVRDDTGTMLVG